MTQRITTSLQETVRQNDRITNIYFDAKGGHYVTAYKIAPTKDLVDNKDAYKLYGRGKYAGSRLIPGPNVDKLKEAISVGVPETEIVDTMSREDILAAQAIPDGDSAMAQLLADPNAKAHLQEQFLKDPEFLKSLASLLIPAAAPTPAPAEAKEQETKKGKRD